MFLIVGELGNILVTNIGLELLRMLNLEVNVLVARNMWANWEHCFRNKMLLNLFGNIFASREVIFCFRNNVSRCAQTGNHHKKYVSATMFPSLPRTYSGFLVPFHYNISNFLAKLKRSFQN